MNGRNSQKLRTILGAGCRHFLQPLVAATSCSLRAMRIRSAVKYQGRFPISHPPTSNPACSLPVEMHTLSCPFGISYPNSYHHDWSDHDHHLPPLHCQKKPQGRGAYHAQGVDPQQAYHTVSISVSCLSRKSGCAAEHYLEFLRRLYWGFRVGFLTPPPPPTAHQFCQRMPPVSPFFTPQHHAISYKKGHGKGEELTPRKVVI